MIFIKKMDNIIILVVLIKRSKMQFLKLEAIKSWDIILVEDG